MNGIDPSGGIKLPYSAFNFALKGCEVVGKGGQMASSLFKVASRTFSILVDVGKVVSTFAGAAETNWVGNELSYESLSNNSDFRGLD